VRHYSIRTEEAYVQSIRRFILFHKKRHPQEIGVDEIRQYLSHLANEGQVSASTQDQALAALLFLYRGVLGREIPFIDGIERAKRPVRVPVVLIREEVERGAQLPRRHSSSDGKPALRIRLAVDGVQTHEDQGC
jgi:site-specific recombinase XerD